MARNVFFSFYYQKDIWRVNQIRNYPQIAGQSAAGFRDSSLWEETKKQGDEAIKRLIRNGLQNTSVTVVLIGSETANRKYVNYEIEQSLNRGNGLLGIYIHNVKDINGNTCFKGAKPKLLEKLGVPCYDWDYNYFGSWVEAAYNNREALASKAAVIDFAGTWN